MQMTPDTALWLGFIVLAYLAGSIPFGLLIGLSKGVDIRQHGSGNIGATNAGRTLGGRIGALCFLLDLSKGAAPVLVAGVVMHTLGHRDLTQSQTAWWFAVAGAAIAGHMHPVWLRFKGGKGVATGFGSLVAMWPVVSIAAFIALAIWILSVRLTRYVGVSSCVAAVSLPISITALTVAFGNPNVAAVDRITGVWPAIAVSGAMAAAVVWRHRGNLKRTLGGTEPRTNLFGPRRSTASKTP